MSWRRPDYLVNRHGQTVRFHCDYPRTDALERFMKLTKRVLTEDDYCIVFTGGTRFRVDDETITTPARFIYQALMGEKLSEAVYLIRTCKTPRCCRLSHQSPRKWLHLEGNSS